MWDYILSADFIHAVIRMATPLIFVGMAAVIGAKASILCIAYEAMMLFAALGGVIGSAYTGSLLVGTITGLAAGAIIAAIFAYFVLYLNTQPLLAGLALNTLGTGGTTFIIYLLTGMKLDTSNLASKQFPEISIPALERIPVLGPILSGNNILFYVAILAVFLTCFFVYKTKIGLRIRAVGESPDAAASVGIDVKRTKFRALMISSVLASFGGLYMSMGYLPYFTNNMTSGRGFIGIAAQNLAQGNPFMTGLYGIVFGAAMAIGNVAQSFGLPSQFASALPYLLTIVGLVIAGIRNRNKLIIDKKNLVEAN